MLQRGWVQVFFQDTERIRTMTLLDAEIRKVPFGELYELRVALIRRYEIYWWMRWGFFGFVVAYLIGGLIKLYQGKPFASWTDLAVFGLLLLCPLVMGRTIEWYFQRKAIREIKQAKE